MLLLLLIAAVIIIVIIFQKISSDRYEESINEDQSHAGQPAADKKRPVGQPFITNAPEHWGVITDEFLESNKEFVSTYDEHTSAQAKRMFMVNGLLLMGKINEALQKVKGEKVLSSYSESLLGSSERWATTCCVDKLFEKGIYLLTGIVIDDYKRFAVVLFDSPTPQSYIDELRQHFIGDGYADLIFYTRTDPSTVTVVRKLKFDSFNSRCFRFDPNRQGANKRKYNSYAIWWQGELENSFMASPVKEDIRVYLDLLDHHNSYALGILSYAFGLKDNNSRTRMPEYDEVTIDGPEGVEIIITLSEKKGINFHFPLLPEYERYRNNFIKAYIEFCYSIRSQIVENDFPSDNFGQPSTLEWYNSLVQKAVELDEEVAAVGLLSKVANWNLN